MSTLCKSKIANTQCIYHTGVQSAKSDVKFNNEVMDIEDLVEFGKKHRACPFYLSKEQSRVELIFLPYNYLLDPHSRKSQNIDVK